MNEERRSKLLEDEFLLYHGYFRPHILSTEALSPYELKVELDDGSAIVFDSLFKTVVTMRRGEVVTDEEWQQEFGRRLNRALWKKGMTQEDLADEVGVSKRMLTRYMNGHSIPSARNISKISKVLECETSDLIDID